MSLEHLINLFTKEWEQKLLEWCKENGIEDVRPYRWDSNEWTIGWSKYGLENKDPILRVIHLRVVDDDNFAAYSEVFRNRALGEPIANLSEIYVFPSAAEMIERLPQLKAYADRLELKDLLPSEQLKPQYAAAAKGYTIRSRCNEK